MCKAFSCLIDKYGEVTWKLGMDSHDGLIQLAGYKDDTNDPQRMKFARVEITPENGDYMYPDKWVLKVDHRRKPEWWTQIHHDKCMKAKTQWLRQLNKILVHKKIVNPFTDKPIVKKHTREHIKLLQECISIGDSIRDSIWDSIMDSIGDSIKDSIWDSIMDSTGYSIGDSIMDSTRYSIGDSIRYSIGAYISSFFKIEKWKNIEHKKGENPFQPCINLWENGIVPSFDGTYWRLHSGKEAQVIYKIHKNKLKKEEK